MKKKNKKGNDAPLFLTKKSENGHSLSNLLQHCNGVTLKQYSKEKGLPVSFLKEIGITKKMIREKPILKIPYQNENGVTIANRYLIELEGKDQYVWKKEAKPLLYGLDQINKAIEKNYVILVENESDCQILWHHKIPAISIPSGTTWEENRDAQHLLKIKKIYLLRGKKDGVDSTTAELSKSAINDRIKVLQNSAFKNLAKMHLQEPDEFKAIIKEAFDSAKSLKFYIRAKQREELYENAKEIINAENIMDMFVEDIKKKGLVGEEKLVKGLYLALTTRLFDDPVCVYVKGNSSTGKSHTVASVLKYFPQQAYYELTSASEKSLIHSKENFKNRFIVLFEAAGIGSAFLDTLIRTLISEKIIKYEVNGKTITKEGPTGFLTTTTSESLRNKENETRYIPFVSDDSVEQNAAVILAKARKVKEGSGKQIYDWGKWLAFHEWLALSKTKYAIPYAVSLAELTNCDKSRIRRDIDAVHNLIGAHAVIHQKNRKINSDGIVIANKEDYSVVYKLISKALSSTISASRSDIEIVREVKRALKESQNDSISMTELAKRLGVDKATVSRNLESPISKGYIVNKETRKGKPAKLTIGKPIEEDIRILPSPKKLWAYIEERKMKKK